MLLSAILNERRWVLSRVVMGEPATSFMYDPKRFRYDQFNRAQMGEADEEEGPGSDSADATTVDKMINPADSIVGRSRRRLFVI
jgi:hypothetical protein